MFKKNVVFFVFFVVSIFYVLPIEGADVPIPKNGKETQTENKNTKNVPLPSLQPPFLDSKALTQIHSGFVIGCFIGNPVSCIPSFGLNIIKGIESLSKSSEEKERDAITQAIFGQTVMSACLNALDYGEKDMAEIALKDPPTNMDYKIKCKTTESNIKGTVETLVNLIVEYHDNNTHKELFKVPISFNVERRREIAKNKCATTLKKMGNGEKAFKEIFEEEFKDPKTGDDFKIICSQQLSKESKSPLLWIKINKMERNMQLPYCIWGLTL